MKDKLFRDILPYVSKPIRYTGSEVNIIRKDWQEAKAKMAFAFPDVYEIGMSHIGGKILYGLVNEKSQHLLERTFAPWPDMEERMREERVALYTLESFTPLKDFDVVGFSLQYELTITNVLNMLDLAGIPVLAEKRSDQDPLIAAGGPVVFNPEPFADFFDVFLIGDGEELLLEFLDVVDQTRNLKRQQRLLKMAEIPGIYVPGLYKVEYHEDGTIKTRVPLYAGVPERVRKRVIPDLDDAYFPDKPIVPYMNIVHDRAVLEVMRGCQRGCRFCHAGVVYRPVRERSLQVLEKQAERQLQHTGYEEISLASLSTLDYTGVDRLVHHLVCSYGERGIGVSLPSLRVDAFSIDLANEVQKVRKTTLTLAPEAGSQRLRDVINKNVSEEQLIEAVEAAFRSGWNAVKLYFMMGLPTETEADLEGILDLVNKVRKTGQKHSRRSVEVRASIAAFVPKAHTPFQWVPQNSAAELEHKRNYMMQQKRKGIKLSFHESHTCLVEGALARGDRRLGRVIFHAWQKGCKFDSWSEYFQYDQWVQAFQTCQIDIDFYTQRRRSMDELFPWDFIDTGVSRKFLQSEYNKALQGELTPDCRMADCTGCGICAGLGVEISLKEAGDGAFKSSV